jgi:Mg/Co/Ni transporter MgtE
MGTETSKNNLNPQSSQIEESTSEVNEVTVITKESVSYSLENDNPNQNKKLTECIESQNSLTRIYLVRHLPYKECPEYSLYEDIRDKLKEKLTKEKIHKYLEEKY